jgi:hypothetical protein
LLFACCSSPSVGRGPGSLTAGFGRKVGKLVNSSSNAILSVMCGLSAYKLRQE